VHLDKNLEPILDHPALQAWSSTGNETVPMFYVTTYIYGVKVGFGTPQKNGTLAVLNDN
jgi:hypothetical protein